MILNGERLKCFHSKIHRFIKRKEGREKKKMYEEKERSLFEPNLMPLLEIEMDKEVWEGEKLSSL